MLSNEAIEQILGLYTNTALTGETMAKQVSISFFPIAQTESVSKNALRFSNLLKKNLEKIGVTIVPYEEALEKVPIKKRAKRLLASLLNNGVYLFCTAFGLKHDRVFLSPNTIRGILKSKRIRPGISIVALGEHTPGSMPIDVTSSFRLSSVISIVEKPTHINDQTNFYEHFDTAMSLFAHHMANIVILVDDKEWVVYNFNASHPRYPIKEDITAYLLKGLIPKIAAPILPLRLKDFTITKNTFDPDDEIHKPLVEDLIASGPLFDKTKLYPAGKKIKDLPFRNSFYAWIGSIHLDHRTGMSYGFLANQLPTKLEPLQKISSTTFSVPKDKDYFEEAGELYVKLALEDDTYILKVPEVWVLSQRSGSDKTKLHKDTDLVKLGLKHGKLYLQTPRGLTLKKDYRPSFDTGVILAHAVGNAILASILKAQDPKHPFVLQLEKKGMALAHWHGYINQALLPKGWHLHGLQNPNVSCSSPQSAIYALSGKLTVFKNAQQAKATYGGDIHIEPHHGTNITYPSLIDLATLFISNEHMVSLGNKYLE